MKINNKGTFTDLRLSFALISVSIGFMVGIIDFVQPTYRNTLLLKIISTPTSNIFEKLWLFLQKIFASIPSIISGFIVTVIIFILLLLLMKFIGYILSKREKT